MKKTFTRIAAGLGAVLVVAGAGVATASSAQAWGYDDDYTYGSKRYSGYTDSGDYYSLRGDSRGGYRGYVGDDYTSLRSDGRGGYRGYIGDDYASLRSDGRGGYRGYIGDEYYSGLDAPFLR